MKIEIIDNWNDLASLESDWNTLLEQSTNNSIFQTWEWTQAWKGTIEEIYKPLIFVCRDASGELAGVAAFYVCNYKLAKFIPFKVLRSFGEPHSGLDYPGLIVRRKSPDVIQLLLRALSENSQRWDAIWLPMTRTWGEYHPQLMEQLEASKLFSVFQRPCMFTYRELSNSVDEVMSTLSKSKRTILKRTENKIKKNHDAEIHLQSDGDALVEQMETLFKLHELRWRSAGEPGAFIRRPKLREFYEAFVPVAKEKGWLRLHVLSLDGKPCAAQIGYRYGDTYYSVQEGFDPDAIAGSGNHLRIKVMLACAEEGISEYDFLAGPSEHKRSWGGVERQGSDILIYNANIKCKIALLGKCWPGGRALQEQPLIR